MNAQPMRIAVLFGGTSMERDVSVASAAQVITALRGRGHSVVAVDAARGPLSATEEAVVLADAVDRAPPEQIRDRQLSHLIQADVFRGIDVAFLAMHGGEGENGTLQALLDLAGVCYTGSGQLGSAIAMDKDVSKRLFRAAGVPTADWLMTPAAADEVGRDLGYPLIVKPNSQGSTVGLSLVRHPDELDAATANAHQFDKEVMLERYVPGRELTVGIVAGEALSVGEIVIPGGGLFDYESKYQVGGANEIFPADITAAIESRVKALALKVNKALKLACYCRVDFRLDPDGQLWCLEVNTLPGLTASSLLPRSAAASGIEFAQLCETICQLALQKE